MRGALLLAVVAVAGGCDTSPPDHPAQAGITIEPPVAEARVAEARVLGAHARRFAAMTAGDLPRLAVLLSDDLVYVHSDGGSETREQFLDALRRGDLKYRVIEPSDTVVRTHGAAAVVTGRARMVVETGGAEREIMIRYTAVYAGRGDEWRLLSWQSTRAQR